jgi:hypothetical protein
MVNTIRFKKWPYRLYSPWLFKLIKLRAKVNLYRWGFNQDNLHPLANFYWNQFLANRISGEMKHKGAKIYRGEKLNVETDTVYVLACGSSINNVSDKQWNEIRQHYSIGVNAFYVHEFTANAYFTEFTDNPYFHQLISQRLFENTARVDALKYISAYYAVVETSSYRKPDLSDPIFYSPDRVRIRDHSLLERIVDKYYSANNCMGRLLHQRSNLDLVINYCVTQGFKNIVLVGVDLNNDGYFWESKQDPHSLLAKQFMDSFRAAKGEQKGGVHATASIDKGEVLDRLNIVEYIEFLNYHLLEKKDVTISVANSNSLLAEHLPVTQIPEWCENKE